MKINYFSCHGNQKQLITMSYMTMVVAMVIKTVNYYVI